MVTGHIVNFAKRRGVDIEMIAAGEVDEHAQVWFYDSANDCEPVLMYIQNNDQSLTYRGKLMKSLEDMPAWIDNKDKLKKVICYLSDTLKAEKV